MESGAKSFVRDERSNAPVFIILFYSYVDYRVRRFSEHRVINIARLRRLTLRKEKKVAVVFANEAIRVCAAR